MAMRSVGVEEELLLVDAETARPRALAAAVLRLYDSAAEEDGPGGTLEAELKQEQIEVDTTPCFDLRELRGAVVRARGRARSAAEAVGAQVAALATSPMAAEAHTTAKLRYLKMAEYFGVTEWDYLTCGCHVHVSVDSPDEGVAVLDRIRPWLPVLLALSANSPFCQDADTRYHSYRSQMTLRWPTSGPTEVFGTSARYGETVDELVASGAAMDPAMIYFDARLSQKYPTIELRVTDVCLYADDTVLIAALARALVETAAKEAADGTPPAAWRTDLLRSASWRAGRHGVSGQLVHPRTKRLASVSDVVSALVEHVRPALEETGDLAIVREQAAVVMARGSGAARQREVYARSGSLADVVADAVTVTAR